MALDRLIPVATHACCENRRNRLLTCYEVLLAYQVVRDVKATPCSTAFDCVLSNVRCLRDWRSDAHLRRKMAWSRGHDSRLGETASNPLAQGGTVVSF